MINPQLYKRNINVIRNVARSLFEEHEKHLKWNGKLESIADIGIGDGTITKEVILPIIPNNIKEYVGIDISETMLKSAERLVKHPKFKTVQLDITTKDVPQNLLNKFSHIFASYLFHTIGDNIRQALTNIYNMLQPGGQVFFTAFAKNPINESYIKLDQTKWAKYCNTESLSCFHDRQDVKSEYEKLLQNVGFKDLQMFNRPNDWFFSEEALEDLLEAVNLRLAFVDEKDRNDYITDYIKISKQLKNIYFVPAENKFVIHVDIITGIAMKPVYF